jgi:HSP20 family protein
MALMRRDPRITDLASLLSRPMFAWPDWLTEQFQTTVETDQIPVEEFEENGQHVIRAELPGVDPDHDVEITVQNGVLHIRAERREETKEKKPHYYRQEIRYGAFVRNIALPAGCSEEDVTAEYADGLLTIRLPMAEEKAAATKVPVTRR